MRVALLCMVLGAVVSIVLAPIIIRLITKLKAGQNILGYVDKHKAKQGTPTMGGIIFILSLIVIYIVVGGYKYAYANIVVGITIAYFALGLLDDYLKVRYKHNEGLKAYQKAIGQVGIAVIASIYAYFTPELGGEIVLPFGFGTINIGAAIIPFVIFVYLAVTNAVNLTDGLDGLASGCSYVYLIIFGIITYIYLTFVSHQGGSVALINQLTQVIYLTFGFAGAILGFGLFNTNPAKIFMGDAGSLAIGGFMATTLMVTKLYLYMPIVGIMFVLSTISVIVQVVYYKCTHKRIFKMAPLHHHFELNGASEGRIGYAYMLCTMLVGLVCIALSIV